MPRARIDDPHSAPRDELESIPEALLLIDASLVITYANPAAAHLLGTTRDRLLGRELEAWFNEAARAEFLAKCGLPGWSGVVEDFSYALQKWLSYKVNPGPDGYAIWALDVTTERLGNGRSEWTDELAQTMLDAVPAGTVVLDTNGTIVLVNQQWDQFWGSWPGNSRYVPGENYFDMWRAAAESGNQDAAIVLPGLQGLVGGDSAMHTFDFRWSTHENDYWYRMRAALVAGGDGIYITHTDITALAAELGEPSKQDPLTGLASRDEIETLLRGELQRRTTDNEVSVLLVDIDGFREFNDALGPTQGDQLLRLIAHRIDASTRPSDTLGRLTGDEFVVIARGCQSIAARALAAGFVSVLEPSFELGTRKLTITASVGVATSSAENTDPVQLIHDATTAMHAAKSLGRSSHQVFSSDLRDSNRTRLEILERLRGVAMAEHELEMLYQPIVEVSSGIVIGAEALIRWNHPDLGLLMPDTFIPLAEDAGLIIPLSNWILNEVGRTIASWQNRGIAAQIGINVSPLHFAAGTLATDVIDVIDSLGIEPGRVVLELAESKSLHNVDAVQYQLLDVRRHGVLVAIDDFGSGFSSLERLATLPVDILKIDKSLTQHLDSKNLQRRRAISALCKAVVDVSHDLGKDTVVEGIETPEQMASCADMGVTFGQGHLLGRPMTAVQLERVLRQDGTHSASA